MSFKLFACGDIVNSTANKNFVDQKLKKIIEINDVAICNFEAPLIHKDMKGIRKAGPYLCQPKKSIKYLKEMGFNFVSLANNHIYDYGQRGMEETVKELQIQGLDYIGGGIDFNEAYQTKIIKKNKIKIGLLSACENEFGCLYEKQDRGGYAWLFHNLIEDNIKYLKTKCDFIILSAHAGVEDISIPIKEWKNRFRRLIDVGVDVIIGHHPHVPQGYEKYNNSLIFYSLGNFYFDTPSFIYKENDSYSIILKFSKNKEIEFSIVYHKKIDGKTCLVKKDQVNFDLDILCGMLHNDYEQLNNDISVNLFNKYYYSYYENALGLFPKNARMLDKTKFAIKKILFPNKTIDDRNLMLLHNIRIDSHRFIVQRALSLISEDMK